MRVWEALPTPSIVFRVRRRQQSALILRVSCSNCAGAGSVARRLHVLVLRSKMMQEGVSRSTRVYEPSPVFTVRWRYTPASHSIGSRKSIPSSLPLTTIQLPHSRWIGGGTSIRPREIQCTLPCWCPPSGLGSGSRRRVAERSTDS